jgi:mannose-1-phosphate guanylyltransferase
MQVIPVEMGWTDVGTWGLLYTGMPKDESQNVTQGDVKIINSKNNLVWSTCGKTIALVEVDGVAVVDTEDAILICGSGKTGEVKKLIEKLEEERSNLT